MPYTRITGTPNGAEAIAYAEGNGHGHNGAEARNLYVGAVNMAPDGVPFAKQMQPYWDKASAKNKTQVRRVVLSFSRNELAPDDPASVGVAAQIATDFVNEAYPDRQACYYVQNDGKGGCLHVHVLVNNVSMTTHKGCTAEQTHFSYVKEKANAVIGRYVTLDFGQHEAEKVTQMERVNRQDGKYVWKDDLRERIRAARDEAVDLEDFKKRLTLHGVECDFTGPKSKKTREKHGHYVVYELTDTAGFGDDKVPENLRSKSYKLGDDFGLESLENFYSARAAKAKEKEPEPVSVKEQPKEPEPEPVKQNSSTGPVADFDAWAKANGYRYSADTFVDAYMAFRQGKPYEQPPEPVKEQQQQEQPPEPVKEPEPNPEPVSVPESRPSSPSSPQKAPDGQKGGGGIWGPRGAGLAAKGPKMPQSVKAAQSVKEARKNALRADRLRRLPDVSHIIEQVPDDTDDYSY